MSLALSVAVLLALAAPILGMTTGTSGVSALPERFESRQGFTPWSASFLGHDGADGDRRHRGAGRPAARRALDGLQTTLSEDSRFGPGRIERSADGETAVLTVPFRATRRERTRSRVSATCAPRSSRRPSATRTRKSSSAGSRRRTSITSTRLSTCAIRDRVRARADVRLADDCLQVGVIAGLSVLLNLLSVGAAFGLLVLVFQHGVGAGIFGFQQVDSIEAWVPLFLFSVLFGLSMDYQVFMLSRIKERYEETRDTGDAVYFGVASTARIITGAALIIVAVFAGFARGDLIMFQQMGFGVAVALLIDATVIRSVLLPAAMRLLGRWNWYVPGWLEWLPRVRLEARGQN